MNAQKTTQLFQENKNIFLLIVIIILSLALLYYVLFVNPQTSQFFGIKPTPTPKHYEKLDSILNQVINAPDKPATVKSNQIASDKNGIKVYIIANDNSFIFSSNYGIQNSRTGKYIQASTTYSQLEELAKNPKISRIQAIKETILPPGVKIEDFKQPLSEKSENKPLPISPTIAQ